MIHEVAIQPEAFIDICLSDKFELIFKNTLGLGTPRVLTPFPDKAKWEQQVREICNERLSSPIGKAKVLAALQFVSGTAVVAHREYIERDGSWTENVLESHRKRAYKCIISNDELSGVIQPHSIKPSTKNAWYLPSAMVLQYSCEEALSAISPLLKACKTLIIVDPYFNLQQGNYQIFLQELMRIAHSDENSTPLTDFKIFTSVKRRYNRSNFYDCTFNYLDENDCPVNLEVYELDMSRQDENDVDNEADDDSYDDLHNRYILTELGGLSCGKGFGLKSKQGLNETDDWYVLPKEIYYKRFNQYNNYNKYYVVNDECRVEVE